MTILVIKRTWNAISLYYMWLMVAIKAVTDFVKWKNRPVTI